MAGRIRGVPAELSGQVACQRSLLIVDRHPIADEGPQLRAGDGQQRDRDRDLGDDHGSGRCAKAEARDTFLHPLKLGAHLAIRQLQCGQYSREHGAQQHETNDEQNGVRAHAHDEPVRHGSALRDRRREDLA